MTRTLAYKHFQGATVHLYTECPNGSVISTVRRDSIQNETSIEGMALCSWCQARANSDLWVKESADAG
jgi:hypothetical protein